MICPKCKSKDMDKIVDYEYKARGDSTLTHFKCVKCGFVSDVKKTELTKSGECRHEKGEMTGDSVHVPLRWYCIKCDALLVSESPFDNIVSAIKT